MQNISEGKSKEKDLKDVCYGIISKAESELKYKLINFNENIDAIKLENGNYHKECMKMMDEINVTLLDFNKYRNLLMEDWNKELILFQENREIINNVLKELNIQAKKTEQSDELIIVIY